MNDTNSCSKIAIKKKIVCNPSIFITLTEPELLQWKHKLLGETIFFINTNDLLTKHTLSNSSKFAQATIIHFDTDRTRVIYTHFFPSFKSNLESILLYYCIENSIPYKQGINEILAPFLFLSYQYPDILTIVEAYQMFIEFINQFAYNYIIDNDFIMLRQSLSYCSILLHYHNPILYELFEEMGIVPEMYALSWILTVFSSKVNLEVLYRLWNELIIRGDQYMPYYILIALLKNKTKEFLTIDTVQVMSLVCGFTIVSQDHLEEIMIYAIHIKDTTPDSFRMMIDKIGIFKRRKDYIVDKSEVEKNMPFEEMEIIPIMPILPGELCHIVYPDIFKCTNISCKNFYRRDMQLINSSSSDNNTEGSVSLVKIDNGYKKKRQCWICNTNKEISTMNSITPDSYVIFDIRERKHLENCGLITKSIFIDDDFLLNEEQEKLLLNKLKNEKCNYHFIILLSKTSYISSYEKDLLDETKKDSHLAHHHPPHHRRTSSNTKQKKNYALVSPINKSSKSLKDCIQAVFGNDLNKKLKEYQKFKILIHILTKNDFPYISYSYGGFEIIHSILLQHSIPIILHLYSKCLICNKHRRIKRGKSQTLRSNSNCIIKEMIKTSNDRQHKQQLPSKALTLSLIDLNDIISSLKYQIYFTILVEYEERRVNKNEQLVLLINHKELIIYRKIVDKEKGKRKEEDYFVHLETYLIEEIVSARRDMKLKNVIMLMFLKESYLLDMNENRLNERIAIDFNNNEESKRFMLDLKDFGKRKDKGAVNKQEEG